MMTKVYDLHNTFLNAGIGRRNPKLNQIASKMDIKSLLLKWGCFQDKGYLNLSELSHETQSQRSIKKVEALVHFKKAVHIFIVWQKF